MRIHNRANFRVICFLWSSHIEKAVQVYSSVVVFNSRFSHLHLMRYKGLLTCVLRRQSMFVCFNTAAYISLLVGYSRSNTPLDYLQTMYKWINIVGLINILKRFLCFSSVGKRTHIRTHKHMENIRWCFMSSSNHSFLTHSDLTHREESE